MIVYNVTVSVDPDAHDEWLVWMTQEHIPRVMSTGLFLQSRMSRMLSDDQDGTTYSIQYTTADMPTYERYRNEHAARLQSEANERFGGRFHAFRTLMEVVHSS